MDKNVLYGILGLGLGLFGHRWVPWAYEVGIVVLVIAAIMLFRK